MSYENTSCPCGGHKEVETMLCDACERKVAKTYDRIRMDDPAAPWGERRRSAIRVLAAVRKEQPL